MAAAPQTIGPYQVVRELGRGGMGVVYEGLDPVLGRRVALKVLLEAGLDADALARFEREARLLARVKHPGVVVVHALERSGRLPVLVTELIEGARELERGPLPPREAAAIVREVATALGAAHAAGVLHRDLKPANVLRRADGSLVLLDFGVARELDGSSLTRTGDVVGTPAFMAPEQVEGRRDLDARADVYGLGALLYVLLVGAPPFVGGVVQVMAAILERDPPWPRERVGTPEGLDAIVRRAMAKAPQDRPATAAELALELDRWLTAPAAERPGRRPWVLGGAALAAVTLCGLGVRVASRPPAAPTPVHEPPPPSVLEAAAPEAAPPEPVVAQDHGLEALLVEARSGALTGERRGEPLHQARVPDEMYAAGQPLFATFIDARRLAVGVRTADRAGVAHVTSKGTVDWTVLPSAGVGPITRVAALGGGVAVGGPGGIDLLGPGPGARRPLARTPVADMVAAGKRLLFTDWRSVWFVDVDGGAPRWVQDLEPSTTRKDVELALSPDGTAGVVVDIDGRVGVRATRLYRLRLPGPASEAVQSEPLQLPPGPLNRRCAAISLDGRFAFGGEALNLEVWTEGASSTTPLETAEERRNLPTLIRVAFSPGGRFVYAISQSAKEHLDDELVAWAPGAAPRRVVRDDDDDDDHDDDEMSSLSVSPDGLLLAIGVTKGRLELWVAGDDLR